MNIELVESHNNVTYVLNTYTINCLKYTPGIAILEIVLNNMFLSVEFDNMATMLAAIKDIKANKPKTINCDEVKEK